jgi:DNA polymerase eta
MHAYAHALRDTDMDSFYTAIEVERAPDLRGRPVAVIQYSPSEPGGVSNRPASDPHRIIWPPTSADAMTPQRSPTQPIRGSLSSSLIAVSYEARAFGVKRSMNGREARAVCPQIVLVSEYQRLR